MKISAVRVSLIAALWMMAALPVTAQDGGAAVTFNLLPAEGVGGGTTVRIDADYASEHQTEVPAPFSFVIPLADGIDEQLDTGPQSGATMVKVNFATPDDDLIENIQFVPLHIPEGELQTRLNTLAGILATDGFGKAVQNKDQSTRDLVRATKTGGYDGVEVIGRYLDPDLGAMYVRLVGILNPNGPEGVVAIANVVDRYEPLAAPNDFPQTRGGTLLKNFKFLDQ